MEHEYINEIMIAEFNYLVENGKYAEASAYYDNAEDIARAMGTDVPLGEFGMFCVKTALKAGFTLNDANIEWPQPAEPGYELVEDWAVWPAKCRKSN